MKTIKLVPRDGANKQTVVLGRCGENTSTRVEFDLSNWIGSLAKGSVTLWVIPATGTGYFAAVDYNNFIAGWTLANTDLSKAGAGEMELHFTSTDGSVSKSCIFATNVLGSLTDGSPSTTPQYLAPWQSKVEADLLTIASDIADAKTASTSASSSATAAKASETASASSATSAQGSATAASTSATAANSSATAAASSATSAQTSATSATSSATAAQTSATAAATSATSAAASSSSASSSAETATTKANAASNSASTAQTYAASAITAKESAETSEQNASNYATSANASKTAAAASQSAAAQSATSASESKNTAVSASNTAQSNAQSALAYKTAAQTAAQSAESSKQSVDTTKAYLDQNYGTLSSDVTQLKSDLTDVETAVTDFTVVPVSVKNGAYYYYDTGAKMSESVACYTELIPIDTSLQYDVSTKMGASGCAVAFFDSDKTYMKSISVKGTGQMFVHLDMSDYTTASYVAFSSYNYNPVIVCYKNSPVTAKETIDSIDNRLIDIMPVQISATSGYYYLYDNGSLTDASSAYYTGLIYINHARKYKVTTKIGATGCAVAFFDADHKYIKNISIKGDGNVTTIDLDMQDYTNACYIAFSGYNYTPVAIEYKDSSNSIVETTDDLWNRYDYHVNCFNRQTAKFYNDRYVNPSGVITVDNDSSSVAFEVEPNTHYFLNIGSTQQCNRYVSAFFTDSTFTYGTPFTPTRTGNMYEFTTNQTAKYAFVYVYNSNSFNWANATIRLEKDEYIGSDKVTLKKSYIPADALGRHYNTFSIIGDSYSTFAGYLADENALAWYPPSGGNEDTNDVNTVEKTWWFKFANKYGSRLMDNDSWSGSTISYDGYGTGTDDGKETSFLMREGKITKPEIIFVFGGTNDEWVSNDSGRTDFLGEYKYSNFTENDYIYFRPSLASLLDKIKRHNVGAKIVFVLNSGLTKINESVNTICTHYGIDVIALHDIDKAHSHPTDAGMTAICNQIYDYVMSH